MSQKEMDNRLREAAAENNVMEMKILSKWVTTGRAISLAG
jgi:hypothetical protein